MPRGVFANPTLVDRLTSPLIATVAGNPELIARTIVDRRMDQEHAESQKVSSLEFSR
jgi:hypothetical protein